MKQVDFYLISNHVNQAKFKLAGRLANKLQRLDKRALIVTESSADTAALDSILWSFSDTSFVAHDKLEEAKPLSAVHIGGQNDVTPTVLERQYDVLINVGTTIPLFSHHFARIAEIVDADDDAKQAARARYKRYQSEGFELKTHTIEL
ncbi:DNA polymerase III subunit chi [Arenicella xantha]|uniref:DNA polymerase III chi subunit n=1 Tax=Arenicella xantha TaxID=644221 RepID=A0A395JK07_9GAMM|nr:DNA polymerase III subunit chi [Arenicella xantha]RBP49232.1 DNA polymerase III chi subunit [Arenicella xantha]